MAKTKKRPTQRVGPQAPRGAWTAEELLGTLRSGTPKEKAALLRSAGFLTRGGEVAPKYRNWGRRITRTPDTASLK